MHEALCKLINRGSFHGNDLVLASTGPDNVYNAEKAILRAEAAGLIERGKYDPAREQLFFGLGGFLGDRLRSLPELHRNALAHHWITKTTQWLEPKDIP